MVEHADQRAEQVREPDDVVQRRSAGQLRGQVVGVVAAVVRWAGLLCALILAAHVVLTVGNANPANGITSFLKSWADSLALGFKDLFTPADDKLRILVNYSIAAIFWLVVSAILTRLIRRLD